MKNILYTLLFITILTPSLSFSENVNSNNPPQLTQTLEVKAVELIDFLQDTSGEVIDLGKEQLPVIVSEVIRYEISYRFTLISIFVLGICVIGIFITKVIPIIKDDAASFMLTGFAIAGGVIFTIAIAVNITEVVKPIIAPRIFIIEYVAELVK